MRIPTLLRTAVAGVCATVLVSSPGLVSTASAKVDTSSQAMPTITARLTQQGVSLRGTRGLHAGRAQLVVKGKGNATVSFVTLKAGYRMPAFMKDATAAFSKNNVKAMKRLYAKTDAIGGLAPGSTGTLFFPHPGQYLAFKGGRKISKPVVFQVGSMRHTRAPRVDGRVIAADGPGWKGSSQFPAKGTLLFKNAATYPVLHFMSMQRVVEGTTVEQVLAALQSEQGPQPDWLLSGGLDTDVLAPGRAMTVDYDLAAGQYVVLCFMPDPAMHGMPHALMGMIKMIHFG